VALQRAGDVLHRRVDQQLDLDVGIGLLERGEHPGLRRCARVAGVRGVEEGAVDDFLGLGLRLRTRPEQGRRCGEAGPEQPARQW